MNHPFKKKDRLKSRRLIDALFKHGRVIVVHPFKILWLESELPLPVNTQIGVAVPRRKFPRAVDRNRIKRRMRESVRLHRPTLESFCTIENKQLCIMVLYTGRDIPPYGLVNEKLRIAFTRLTGTA